MNPELCILGFVVKAIKVIPNNYIPLIVVFWSSIFFMLVAPERGSMSSRIWLGRNFLIGLIIGTAAWLFHRYVLKTLFRKFGSDDTVFITKEQTNEKVDS